MRGGMRSPGGRAVSVRPLAVTDTIDFALDSGGRISGAATDGGTGRLLANVTVDVLDQAGASHARTSTTAQGTYLTPGLPAGSYYVRAMPDGGFVPRMFRVKNCAGGACTLAGSTPVAVTAQQTTAGIDFPLQCAVSISPSRTLLPAADSR